MCDKLLKNAYESVQKMMKSFEQTTNDEPTIPADEDIYLRMKLTLEEFTEFCMAAIGDASKDDPNLNNFLQHLAFANVSLNEASQRGTKLNPDLVGVADAITDIEVVNIGAAVTFGIPLDECFKEVQRSNFSKFDEDGRPIKNEYGKFIKGPNYIPPDLKSIVLK